MIRNNILMLACCFVTSISIGSLRAAETPIEIIEGMPAITQVTLKNTRSTDRFLIMGHNSLPRRVKLTVKSQNKLVPQVQLPSGRPSLPSPKRNYIWKKKEGISFSFDLRKFYSLTVGEYDVYVEFDGSQVLAQKVIINKCGIKLIKDIERTVSLPVSMNTKNHKLTRLKCQLSYCEAKLSGKVVKYAVLNNFSFNNDDQKPMSFFLRLPKDAIIEAAELDYKWQLWLKVKNKDKACVVLWDLIRDESKVALNWTKDSVTLDSTMADSGTRKCRVVLVGVNGKTEIVTLQNRNENTIEEKPDRSKKNAKAGN